MRFVTPDLGIPTNFFVHLEASAEERSTLLSYLKFLAVEGAYDRVISDKRFAPSVAWQRWASGTFVGFSGDQLMVKSGHRFVDSYEPINHLPVRAGYLSIFPCIRTCISKIRQVVKSDSLDQHLEEFTVTYRGYRKPQQHDFLVGKHGYVYLRMLEVFNLAKLPKAPSAVVEIRGGACVNAAIMIGAYNCKYAIIDLPETIPVGYAFLKSAFPMLRVALPDVVHDCLCAGRAFDDLWKDFDAVFMLPYQSDAISSDYMDCAFNVSSFQEMRIEVVNEYLFLLRRILKPGGQLLLENLKVSREVPGNSFDLYDLSGFESKFACTPSYVNYVIRRLPGLEYFFYQGQKF